MQNYSTPRVDDHEGQAPVPSVAAEWEDVGPIARKPSCMNADRFWPRVCTPAITSQVSWLLETRQGLLTLKNALENTSLLLHIQPHMAENPIAPTGLAWLPSTSILIQAILVGMAGLR